MRQAAVALLLDLLADRVAERMRRSPIFRRVEKTSRVIKARLSHELQQGGKIGFGLPREADDECRAQPSPRQPLLQSRQQIERLLARRRPLHALEHRVGNVLQRHVDVAAHLVARGVEVDQFLSPKRRISVHQAHPLNALHLGERFQKAHELRPAVEVGPVAHRVL